MVSKKSIIAFEKKVFKAYKDGKIKYPVHLRSGREDELIKVFKKIRKKDYVLAYWDAHDICLLKGVPEDKLYQSILEGHSIALSFPEHNILCSGIAGSLMGVAVGIAWAIEDDAKVYLFCGDMSAEMGYFHEAVKYAYNNFLPVHFVVSDNGISVCSDTRKTWGEEMPWWAATPYKEMVTHFNYENKYPHSGIGKKVKF